MTVLKQKIIFDFLILVRVQVLHGCLQFVLLNIRLIPLTNEIPAINLYIIANEPDRGSAGAKTSRYGPYVLGYRRATIAFTI